MATFTDRQPTRPNRFRVVTETGEAYYVTLERADEPLTPGTPLNAETLNKLVSKDGDTMNGMIFFENTDAYHAYHKFRDVNGVIYGVNAGCGILGGKGVIAFEIREGTETTSPRIARFDIGELGVAYVGPDGKRHYLHKNELVTATMV